MDENLIYKTLMEMKEDVGSIKADVRSLNETFDARLLDAKAIEKRVAALEQSRNEDRGARKIIIGLGTVIGAFLGYLATLFGKH